MQYEFGSGVLYGKSLNSGVQTPIRFGALQGVTLDFSFTQKELYGLYQFPLALARGTAKITGKADFAQFNAQLFNDMFFGSGTVGSGVARTVVAEAQTVTANIVTATNGANFSADLGVVRASDGVPYTTVANSPVGLQYSCNATTGVYTFNTSQNAVAVLINYNYADAASGKKITITNQLLGAAPQFSAVFYQTFQAKQLTLALNACMSSKLSIPAKLEDFWIASFDFAAYADASNGIGYLNFEE